MDKSIKDDYDDLEGNIQYCTAKYHRVDYFVTNDLGMLKHKWDGVTAIFPGNCLKQ